MCRALISYDHGWLTATHEATCTVFCAKESLAGAGLIHLSSNSGEIHFLNCVKEIPITQPQQNKKTLSTSDLSRQLFERLSPSFNPGDKPHQLLESDCPDTWLGIGASQPHTRCLLNSSHRAIPFPQKSI